MSEPGPLTAAALRCRALADAKRLRLLEELRGGERCVAELVAALGMGQSLVSFHLGALKQAGLVAAHRRGRRTYYSTDPAALEELAALLTGLAEPPELWAARCCA
ncbi:MAG: ArsR/SmtB family transcription factor [Longimicrobiales bacterium]